MRFWGIGGFVIALISVPAALKAAPDSLSVSDFKGGSLKGWQEKVFKNETAYDLVEGKGGKVLKASAKASASGLFREITIDLAKTPCLTWSWKVDQILEGLDEKTKGGDDYPARVYVVFSGGAFFWKTRALNYVWSSGQPKGSWWPNAFSERSLNIVVQSGGENVGRWMRQSRNIKEDYLALVGEEINQADAVAIMTDTDNSGRTATAYYGDISFTKSCSKDP